MWQGLQRALGWFHTPFQTPLDPIHIALTTVIVVTVFFLWSRVLAHHHLE